MTLPAAPGEEAKAGHGRVLVAGIGNVFMADDGFGVEVVRRMAGRTLPARVEVADFGIRGFDLAYALMEPYEAAILVDAVPRGQEPGELFVLEPDLDQVDGNGPADGHGMDPMSVLRLVKQFGGQPPRLYILGCEPASLGPEEGAIGFSEPVEASLDGAVALLEDLLQHVLKEVEVG